MTDHVQYLKSLGACSEAVEWAATQPSLEQAWQVCERGDRMLWLAARVGVDRRELVRASCDCAELAKPYWPEGDDGPAEALRVARAWADGRATLEEARDAAAASDDAATAAASAYAAAYAAAAAAYAAAAAAANVYDDADDRTLAKCATICRRYWPTVPEVKR